MEPCGALAGGGDALARAELPHDLAKITRQGAFPTKGVDAVGKAGGHQFLKTMHALDARVIVRQDERRHGRQEAKLSSAWLSRSEAPNGAGEGNRTLVTSLED